MAKGLIEAISHFFEEGIWLERRESRKVARFFLRLLQVSVLVAKGFLDNKCFLRASALSYTTLLSLVPLLAFVFSILKGLGVDEIVRPIIMDKIVAAQQPVAEKLVEYVSNTISNTSVTALGTLGLITLLYTVIKVLSTVEASFNDIWGVTRGRTWLRKLSDYTSVMVIAPVLLVVAMSVSTYLSTHRFSGSSTVVTGVSVENQQTADAHPLSGSSTVVTGVSVENQQTPDAHPLSGSSTVVTAWEFAKGILARTGPYIMAWIAFTAFYAFMPNAQVSFTAALAGGIAGGTIWQLAFWAYTRFQVGLAKYSVIYTSFAALPVFLVWLYISWVIALFGAEVSFATANIETYKRKLQKFAPSPEARERIALRVFFEVAEAFHAGQAAPDAQRLANAAGIPVRSVREVIAPLLDVGLLSEVKHTRGVGYQPGRDLSVVTPATVLAAVRGQGDAIEPREGDALWAETVKAADQVCVTIRDGEAGASVAAILGARVPGKGA